MENDERPRRPRRAAWLLAGVLALALSGVLFEAGLPGTSFDPAGWREADGMVGQGWSRGPLRDNRRARMVGELMAHHLRPGMTPSQVQALLGPPGSEGGGNDDWVQNYDLLAFPGRDQEWAAWLRWRTTRPILTIEYAGPPLQLRRAGIRR